MPSTVAHRWALGLALIAGTAAAWAGAGVPEREQAFAEAIAGRFDALDDLLDAAFVYRTTAGTRLGKAGLIAHLRSGATAVTEARLHGVQRVETANTVVSNGGLRVTVAGTGGSAARVVDSQFTHVWVREGSAPGHWTLLFREARIVPPTPDAAR